MPDSQHNTAFGLVKQYWKHDLIASISVALVALPLGLGIAIASNTPPIAGLIAAIVGGLLVTFIRGSHVAINGPGAGIIVAVLTGVDLLADENGGGFPYVLAAICMAGLLQILIGLFRMGRLAELVPNAVVEGMLAAIGIIILGKQVHIGLGQNSTADSAMGSLLEIPGSLLRLDPRIAAITAVSLFIMIIYPRIRNKLFHFLPAPVWVLIFAVPFVFLYEHLVADIMLITDPSILFPQDQLIDLPADLWADRISPNFSKMNTASFWLVTISIMIMASIETLISTKAIDNLDPLSRKTNLNRELLAVGIGTAVSGLIGGLPVMTVIVRSSVNINNNAKTRMSNFYHGAILLALLLLLKPVVEEVPLAALAAILIFTGYKLAAPKQFADAYERGEEQLLIMVITVLAVLLYGLMGGIALGICMTFIVQWIKSRMSMQNFVQAVFRPKMTLDEHEGLHELKLNGVFNFLNMLRLKALIKKLPEAAQVKVDLSQAILIDFSVMGYLKAVGKSIQSNGGQWNLIGLDDHETTSNHPHSMRLLQPQNVQSTRWMNDRQRDLMKFASQHRWQFAIGKEWANDDLRGFPIFKAHTVEYVHNCMNGQLQENVNFFRLQDIVFDEGALIGKIVYHTTTLIVDLREEWPPFALEREELYDKLLQMAHYNDVDFDDDPEFSDKMVLSSEHPNEIRNLFSAELRKHVCKHSTYRMECSGSQLLVFENTRLLNTEDIQQMIDFADAFLSLAIKPIAEAKEGAEK